MCYGSLDPKHLMREMDARLKPLAHFAEAEKTADAPLAPGLMARLRGVWALVRRKEARHV